MAVGMDSVTDAQVAAMMKLGPDEEGGWQHEAMHEATGASMKRRPLTRNLSI